MEGKRHLRSSGGIGKGMKIECWGLVQGSFRNKFILPSMRVKGDSVPLLTHWTSLPPLGGHSPPTKAHFSPSLPPPALGLLVASSDLHPRTPQALSQWVGMGSHPVIATQGALRPRATFPTASLVYLASSQSLHLFLKNIYSLLFGCTGLIWSMWDLQSLL